MRVRSASSGRTASSPNAGPVSSDREGSSGTSGLRGARRMVDAWAARHAHRRFEDVAYLRLFYDDVFDGRGMSANIHVSWLDPCKVRRVTAVGSKKMAVYDDLAADERIRVLDKGVSLPPDGGNLTQPPTSTMLPPARTLRIVCRRSSSCDGESVHRSLCVCT